MKLPWFRHFPWLKTHGFSHPPPCRPVLRALHPRHRDAIEARRELLEQGTEAPQLEQEGGRKGHDHLVIKMVIIVIMINGYYD